MDPMTVGWISVVAVLVLLALRIPIAVTLGMAGVVGMMVLKGPLFGMAELMNQPYAWMSKYLLIVVPLFVIMGNFAFHAGVTHRAFDMGRAWFSRFPAGLAMATVAGCAAFGACCGSSVAAAATMGRVAIPEMQSHGYDRKLAAGTVAAGGLLAIMIPPSTALVLYGVITDTSIGALLIAGIIPGILNATIFIVGLYFLARRNPKLAPPAENVPWKQRFASLRYGWGIALLFVTVMGGIYSGIFTPTEAAAGGAAVAFIIMVAVQRKGLRSKLTKSVADAVSAVSMLFIIMIGASFYSQFITLTGIPAMLAQSIAGLNAPPIAIVVLMLAIYVPLGMFLDPISILLITTPIVIPVIFGLGFSPVWFGILVTMMIEISLLTPPVGLNVYTVAGVAKHIPLEEIFRGIGLFLIMQFIVLAILIAFPALSTWLPGLMYTTTR